MVSLVLKTPHRGFWLLQSFSWGHKNLTGTILLIFFVIIMVSLAGIGFRWVSLDIAEGDPCLRYTVVASLANKHRQSLLECFWKSCAPWSEQEQSRRWQEGEVGGEWKVGERKGRKEKKWQNYFPWLLFLAADINQVTMLYMKVLQPSCNQRVR